MSRLIYRYRHRLIFAMLKASAHFERLVEWNKARLRRIETSGVSLSPWAGFEKFLEPK